MSVTMKFAAVVIKGKEVIVPVNSIRLARNDDRPIEPSSEMDFEEGRKYFVTNVGNENQTGKSRYTRKGRKLEEGQIILLAGEFIFCER